MSRAHKSTTQDIGTMRARILEKTLTHVPFDGWTEKALVRGAEDAGYPSAMALDAFPGGVTDAIDCAAEAADAAMLATIEKMDLSSMRVHERISAAVRARLEMSAPHREAIQRALAILALPQNLPLAAKTVWRTVDAIWYAVGDNSTDFNYYTKRGLLAGVYSATLAYWLNDHSPENADSWSFLERRIDEVMRVPKLVGKLRERFSSLPSPLDLMRFAPGRRHRMR